MESSLAKKIVANPKFKELVSKRTSFAWILSILMLVVYYGFILVVAFNKELLGTKLSETGVTTIGMPIGVAIIVFSFVITGIYVNKANGEFDALTEDIKREARVED